MKLLKILFNPRVASAVISAVSAVICAVFAGCRLYCGNASLSNFGVEIGVTNSMFHVEQIKE